MQIVELVMAILAAAIIMVLHEFPKAVYYCISSEIRTSKDWWKKIICLHRYIDPIGMVLAVVSYAGFSKPLMFRVQNQKKNFRMGIIGFLCLLVTCFFSVAVLKYYYGMQNLSVTVTGFSAITAELFWIYMAALSAGMFLINLFPVSIFDMGLCIAGVSSRHYLGIIKNDMLIKVILMLAIAMGVIRYFAFGIVKLMLASPF